MSYEKHTWETGEVITALKLNNVEDGVEEAIESSAKEILIVSIEQRTGQNTYTMDHTGAEIIDYLSDGGTIRLIHKIGQINYEFLLNSYVPEQMAQFCKDQMTFASGVTNVSTIERQVATVTYNGGNTVTISNEVRIYPQTS